MHRAWKLWLLSAAFSACSQAVDSEPDVTRSGAAKRPTRCSAEAPSEGEPCAGPSTLACEWGGDDFGRCTTVGTCPAGRWLLTKTAGCPEAPQHELCPSDYGSLKEGGACPGELAAGRMFCDYEQAHCACSSCVDVSGSSDGPKWQCQRWFTKGYPERLGDACDLPRDFRGSGLCEPLATHIPMQCSESGYWERALLNAACAMQVCQGSESK